MIISTVLFMSELMFVLYFLYFQSADQTTAYHDSDTKKLLWDNKAAELQVKYPCVDSGRTLREVWYMGLRTRYGRLTDTRSGQAAVTTETAKTKRDKWILEHFPFLKGHISRQDSVGRDSEVCTIFICLN